MLGTCGGIAGGFCGVIAGGFCGVAAAETGSGIGFGVATGVVEALSATPLGLPPISSERMEVHHNHA